MSAPQYVPSAVGAAKAYESPRRRPESWVAGRPGELIDPGQPSGERLGVQGPDQGYALRLARQFDERLKLQQGEHRNDVVKGCVGVALKRAARYGRAPVKGDLEAAFGLFGFFDESPGSDLVAARRKLFEGVASHHHYREARDVVDLVPSDVLDGTVADVLARRSVVEATLVQ